MAEPGSPDAETYNPWSVVNLVFHHLADQGLHPILGAAGDPGPPAAALLVALGIEPAARATGRSCGRYASTWRRSEPPCSAMPDPRTPGFSRCAACLMLRPPDPPEAV